MEGTMLNPSQSQDLIPAVAASLTSNPVFRSLDEPTREALARQAETLELARGQFLYKQGSAADAIYVLVSGRLGLCIENPDGSTAVMGELTSNASVGEMSLLTGQPRGASVYAIENARVTKLSRAALDLVAEQHPQLKADLGRTILPDSAPAQLAAALTRLFGELDPAVLRDLQAAFEWLHLPSSSILIRQETPSAAMYIVISGRLGALIQAPDGHEHLQAEIDTGESVGEYGLLEDDPSLATVYAIRETTVAQLSRLAFERLVVSYPQAMLQITHSILRRRQRVARYPAAAGVTAMVLAVVPSHRGAPSSALAHTLAETLADSGPTLHLSGERIQQDWGQQKMADGTPEHSIDISLRTFLDEQERKYRYVVYEADAAWSPWTQRCVRQADRVLLVGEAGSDPTPGEVEEAIKNAAISAPMDLVLLQPEDIRRPKGTGRWLQGRQVDGLYHVRLNRQADMERLTRRVTNRALGLVLGGGGARGFAHVGVYRALVEAGMEVDLVGGTSMGSIIAAMIALDLDYQAMRELARELTSPFKLFDPTLPVVSLFSSGKVTKTLRYVCQDARIEDLWRPFFAVSSNLTHAHQKVHRHGMLWQAVRASMAIPGIFSPVLQEGDLHVDGAVLNNLPIDVMHEWNRGGPLVAVNVFPAVDLVKNYRFGPSISGARALASKLFPRDNVAVPLIYESLLRVVSLNDVHQARAKRHLADIYLAPPVEEFGILEFSAYDQIIDIGYRCAQKAIAAYQSKSGGAAVRTCETGAPLSQLDQTLAELETVLGDWAPVSDASPAESSLGKYI